MKKTLLASALTLAMASSTAMAGGIQIDPTGTGSIAGSAFVIDPGSSFGNFLVHEGLKGTGANTAAGGSTVYAHNKFQLDGFGIPGGELTMVFEIPVTSGLTGPADTLGTVLTLTQFAPGTLSIYYDNPGLAAPGVIANEATGAGYNDGVLLAVGDVTVVPPMSFANLSGGTVGNLALNSAVQSITGNGSATIDIEFIEASINLDYVINDLTTASVDLNADDALRLRYTNTLASSTIGGQVVDHGVDGDNDFNCASGLSGLNDLCDVQMQMNSTLSFTGTRVPEPVTLGLMGLGLLGLGASVRKRKA